MRVDDDEEDEQETEEADDLPEDLKVYVRHAHMLMREPAFWRRLAWSTVVPPPHAPFLVLVFDNLSDILCGRSVEAPRQVLCLPMLNMDGVIKHIPMFGTDTYVLCLARPLLDAPPGYSVKMARVLWRDTRALE